MQQKNTNCCYSSLVIVMSFVRWRHFIFQHMQINCDFTLTLISAKFSVNPINTYKFTRCKTVARCFAFLTLYDALASNQKLIDVILL